MKANNNSEKVKEMFNELSQYGLCLHDIEKKLGYYKSSLGNIISGKVGMSPKKMSAFIIFYNSIINPKDRTVENKRLDEIERMLDIKIANGKQRKYIRTYEDSGSDICHN